MYVAWCNEHYIKASLIKCVILLFLIGQFVAYSNYVISFTMYTC